MKRFVTHPGALKFTFFSVVILVGMLAMNGTSAIAKNQNEINNSAFETKKVSFHATDDDNITASKKITGEISGINASAITPDAAINVKLITATLGATITPADAVVTERGIVWGTEPGVTINNNKTPAAGVTGGSFTVDVTGLTRSKTIYYKGYFTDANGTFLSPELSFSNVPVFTGAGSWNDVSKWSVNEVPQCDAGDSVVIDGICSINNLIIKSGAKVTINAARTLNVAGDISDYTNESLIIKADPIVPNGTLTYQNGLAKATVEMYSKASWDLNQTVGSKYSWQFFGIPVSDIIYENTFKDCLVRQHNETSPTVDGLWIEQNTGASLTSGKGYELVQEKPKTYTFKGNLTNADFNPTLDYTTGTSFPGQHILGNPFTAAIDITKIQYVDIEQAVYLYNTGTYNQWLDNSGNTSTGTSAAPGQYTVSTLNTAGKSGVPAQIPSMQGFLVNVIPNGGSNKGSILIPYNAVITNTERQRTPGMKNNTTPETLVTRIDLSGNQSADCMWIFTNAGCTPMFDNGWDGHKMVGSMQNSQLYAMEPGGNLQIDAVSDINGTYLGFVAGKDTEYKLTFTHTYTDTRYAYMYLVDLLENKTTDITASGTTYTFTSQPTPTAVKRFKIVAGTETNTKNQLVNSYVQVFNSEGTIYVKNQSDQQGNFILYNMAGVAIKKSVFKANDMTTFSTSNLVPGAYIAKAATNGEIVTEKIIIR